METLFDDLRFAAGQLRKAPLFSGAAILTLAIGIGATTAIFSTVNATLLRPLPYPRPNELVHVRTRMLNGHVTTGMVSMAELTALRETSALVAGAAATNGQLFEATLVRDDGTPTTVLLCGTSEGFFDVVGLPVVRGRSFVHAEHVVVAGKNVPFQAVISDRAWSTLFARDPTIVGRMLQIAESRVPVTVVGVASPALDLPHGVDFWFNSILPLDDPSHILGAVVRLKPGVTIDQLRGAGAAAMTTLAATQPSDVGRQYVFEPLVASIVGDLGPLLLIVLGATLLLLVLACMNVTNLLLARGTARMREVAVRSALGASRGRIVQQMLTESLVLAAAGALCGAAFAFGAVRLLLVLGASTLPRLDRVPVDGRVLVFTMTVLVVSGLIMGAAPAWRLAAVDVRTLLNESGRSATPGPATSRLMAALIVVEIAVGIALVAGAGWLVQSFARLRAVDPGFAAEGRLVVDVRAIRRFAQPAEGQAWLDELLRRARAAAGDGMVGAAASYPFRVDRDGTLNFDLESEPPDPTRDRGGHIRWVSDGFFEAMGIRLVAGRTFTADDRKETEPVAIVNRAFARLFPDRDILRESLAFGYPAVDRQTMYRIVGVVDDVRYKSLAEAPEPTYYIPLSRMPAPFLRETLVVVRRGTTPQALVAPVRAELERFDPQVMLSFTAAPDIVAATLARQELGMTLMVIFAATALTLAAVGIYGMIAYAAAHRRGEIATRLALGASAGQVFRLMLTSGQRLALLGVVFGVAAAYAAGRIVASSVYGMRAGDPLVLAASCALVGAVAFAATLIPAIGAARLDPARALRSE